MRRRPIVAVLAVGAFAAGGAASATADLGSLAADDSSSSAVFGVISGTEATFTEIPVRLRGELTVQFHGDQATGCAARGLCGFSGTVTWQPPSTGMLDADTFDEHGRTRYDVSLDLSGQGFSLGPPVNGGVTTADVRFAPNGAAGSSSICTDAAPAGSDIEMPVHLRAASLSLAAASPSLLGTRCAGPLQSDIASLLARRVVDVATLSHGHAGVSLVSSSDFAVHGLAGTVTSTVQLELGRPHTERVPDLRSSPGPAKLRTVAVSYRAHLDGSVVTHVQGDPSSCAPLGSCGANGTFALHVHSTPGTLLLVAVTRKRRPLRDALTALGLRKGGDPRGVFVLGFFIARGSTYAVEMAQGATTCTDIAPGGPGAVLVTVTRGRLKAAFGPELQAPHLRCPGPTVSPDNGLASGTARIGQLTRHGGTIHLGTGVKLNDDGYTGSTTSNLALTLSRPKVKITTDALRAPNPG
jgi:hypothetical protein